VQCRRKDLWTSLDLISVVFFEVIKKDTIMRSTSFSSWLLILFISLSFSAGSYANSVSSIPAPSIWENQGGSTLTIDSISNTGLITGTYINRESDYACRNIPYPVTGWAYGTAISFATIWQSTLASCNSITAWTGFLYKGQISSLWSLTINGTSSASQIIRGNDTFERIKNQPGNH